MAAGIVLVEEAGGSITRLDGGPFQVEVPNVLSSNGSDIHQELIRHLA
jgi:myo-inositol-1(or 4)-monophosphatase